LNGAERNGHARPAAAAPAAPRKLRVVVGGLLADQMAVVQSAVGGLLDLRFISKDIRTPNFPQADHVVLVTNFLDHAWEAAAYQTFRREQVHKHKGGVSGLIKMLEGLASARQC